TPGNQGEPQRRDLRTALAHDSGHLLEQDHQADGVLAQTPPAGTLASPLRVPSKGVSFSLRRIGKNELEYLILRWEAPNCLPVRRSITGRGTAGSWTAGNHLRLSPAWWPSTSSGTRANRKPPASRSPSRPGRRRAGRRSRGRRCSWASRTASGLLVALARSG